MSKTTDKKTICAEELVRAIATRLFTNGFGDEASRLVMISELGRDLGGWNKNAVSGQIRDAVREIEEIGGAA